MDQRDLLRKQNPADLRIDEMSRKINISIKNHRQEKWLKQRDNCNPGSKKLWDTVKSLSDKPTQPPNQSIKFNGKNSEPKKIAKILNRQFTPNATTMRKNNQESDHIIIENEVRKAIKKSKCSKSIGPDNLSPIMFKQLGPNAIRYLTDLFNCVIKQSIIPPSGKQLESCPF